MSDKSIIPNTGRNVFERDNLNELTGKAKEYIIKGLSDSGNANKMRQLILFDDYIRKSDLIDVIEYLIEYPCRSIDID